MRIFYSFITTSRVPTVENSRLLRVQFYIYLGFIVETISHHAVRTQIGGSLISFINTIYIENWITTSAPLRKSTD